MDAWKRFVENLSSAQLEWVLTFAPAQLRVARTSSHPRGGKIDHLLPADYKAFVEQIGYPLIGLSYYCDIGFSFLTPEYISSLSPNLPDQDGQFNNDEYPECTHAFFACQDLAHANGWSFYAKPGKEVCVWRVESGQPIEPIGNFTKWIENELRRITEHIRTLDPEQIADLKTENTSEGDPHRVIDYSLNQSFEVPTYDLEDLKLHWVESQSGNPYSYGLIHEDGTWLIPMSKTYEKVKPFQNGIAEVIPYIPWKSGPKPEGKGEWRKINLKGEWIE